MRVDENVFFRQATLRICGTLEIEKTLLTSLDYLAGFMPADLICLQIYEPEANVLRIVSTASRSGRRDANIIIGFDGAAKAVMHKVYERFEQSRWQDAVIVNDPAEDPAARITMEKIFDPDASLLHLVLETADRPLCSVILAAKGKHRYSKEAAQLFSLLKEPFSIAMSNALKYQDVIHLKEALAEDNRFLHRELFALSGDRIIGADSGLKKVMTLVNQVSMSDSSVL
ncbi:MAG: hypothetical protein MI802_06335, partial [Desulfobacterales bacterium]|nr:hypothetical protein [Desulfobacterales bacterium]